MANLAGRQWHFPSKSNPAKSHTVVIAADGRLSCGCNGWIIDKKNHPHRECTHTNEVIAKHGLKVRIGGPDNRYQYVLDAATYAGAPATGNIIGDAINPTFNPKMPTPASKAKVRPIDPITGDTLDPSLWMHKDTEPLSQHVDPMLAGYPSEDDWDFEEGEYVAEEKYNGQRMEVAVVQGVSVEAWSRPQQGKPALNRILEPHIAMQLKNFPTGTYDGEELAWTPGKAQHHSEVRRVGNEHRKYFVVFDVMRLDFGDAHPTAKGLKDTTRHTLENRRKFLEMVFSKMSPGWAVQLSAQAPVKNYAHAIKMAKEVWKQGGEGLILKQRKGTYKPGNRTDWIKVKQLQSEVFTLTGYKAGKLGPQSRLCVKADDGVEQTVKVKNNATQREIEANPDKHIGRKVRCDYSIVTAAGKRENIRFDRWEDQ